MKSYLSQACTAFLLVSLAAACGDNLGTADGRLHVDADLSGRDGNGTGVDARIPTTPTVVATFPSEGGTSALNGSIRASFSEPMDRLTLTGTSFTVTTTGVAPVAIAGLVTYINTTATFRPSVNLPANSSFTATITTAAKSGFGVAMAANKTWSFTTTTTVTPQTDPVELGLAGTFVILAKSGISNVPTSDIRGNLGVSPITATAITGLPLTMHSSGQYSTTPEVTGNVYAANYAVPTPTLLTTAVGDMETALTDAAGRAPSVTELGAGMTAIGATLVPGVYKWSTDLLIPTSITLAGSATDVWIFQIAQNFTMSSGAQIMLSGGALPKNIFWQVSGAVTLNTTTHLEGVLLCQTAITLRSGATINGRMLAQTAAVLDGNMIAQPAP